MNLYSLHSSVQDYMLPCINKQITGFDCPGCGIQRSLVFISNGEFYAAFQMYPAIYTLILFFGFMLFNLKFKFKFSQEILYSLAIINAIIIIVSYIIKMNSIIN